jgi:hypothetical protein
MIKFFESCEHGEPFCKALIIERMFCLSSNWRMDFMVGGIKYLLGREKYKSVLPVTFYFK